MENSFKYLNQQGLIPGPQESKADYLQRAHFCQNLEQELTSLIGVELPFSLEDRASHNILEETSQLTSHLYGIHPQWVPIFFSNYHLTPWHGGCAWIFQLNEATPTSAFLQLRDTFCYQKTYWRLYHRDELIAHELSHVGRMLYKEPQFEEVLAYQTSNSRWRRWFGPIIQSSGESLFFILLLGFLIMADFALFAIGRQDFQQTTLWLKLIPIFFIILASGRLALRHWQFNRCLNNLVKLYESEEVARHMIYRLRDKEICLFSAWSPLQIHEFIDKERQTSFRWKFLLYNYPYTLKLP